MTSRSSIGRSAALVCAWAATCCRADDFFVPARTTTSPSTGMTLVLVREGEFEMGSPPGERGRLPDETPRRVTISRPFYIGTHEVTQDEYAEVMERNPGAFAAGGEGRDRVAGLETGRHPVETVSWYDAVEFCNRLGAKDGLAAVYRIDDPVRLADGTIERANVVFVGGDGYRLPTEAEWEFACRAGTATPFHYGGTTRKKDANCKPSMVEGMYGLYQPWQELGRTAAVGSYPANAWELHDMHGNVAEWCWDWYEERPAIAVDPAGPLHGDQKVVRGGSWLVHDVRCRAAGRFGRAPAERSYDTGFRVARTPP